MDRRNFLAVLGAVGASEVIPSWLFKKMASPGLITTEIPRFPISDFYPGELTIIGGRPSMGKTAALYQTALLASVNQNKTVALFSLEKNSTSTVRRLLQTPGKPDTRTVQALEAVCRNRKKNVRCF